MGDYDFWFDVLPLLLASVGSMLLVGKLKETKEKDGAFMLFSAFLLRLAWDCYNYERVGLWGVGLVALGFGLGLFNFMKWRRRRASAA